MLISASRRSDIPRFYAEWFRARRAAGSAEFQNVFGVRGRVSLLPQDVLGYLFWTRDPAPLAEQLAELRRAGIAYAFQLTVTAYGRELEPHRPDLDRAIEQFREVSRGLPDPQCIQWRYDPIVLSARYPAGFHRDTFRRIAERLAGFTRVVNTSVVEPYLRAVRRMADPTILYRTPDPGRHRTTLRRHPELGFAGALGAELACALLEMARHHGMQLRSCANRELGLPPSQCCGPELFAPYGDEVLATLSPLERAPSRSGCRCMRSVDIGMNETCLGGCRYCYVVSSDRAALEHAADHDPNAPALRRLGPRA